MELRSFLQYLEFERRYSPHTISAYRNDLLQFSSYLKETYDSDDILATHYIHIRSWLVSLMEDRVNTRTINRKLSSLKTYFRFQLKRGAIRKNPTVRVVAPKMAKRLPDFIKTTQMDQLWKHYDFGEEFPGVRNRLIFELFYATGMRRSDLINLSEKNVSWYDSSVKVLGKGNKERVIPITRELKALIKAYISKRNNHFKSDSFPSLLVDDKCKKMNPRFVYRVVNSVLKNVTTVERKSPHVLRHTFATHLLNNGAQINAIKELLGHSSLAATQVYTHNTIEKLKDVYRIAHPKA